MLKTLRIVSASAAILAAFPAVPPALRTVSATAALQTQSGIRPPELSAVSRPVFLPDDAAPSPDGRLLALFNPEGLAVRDLATGDVRVLVKGFRSSANEGLCSRLVPPAWSSDSARLAYTWCTADGTSFADGTLFTELRTIGADGRAGRTVLPKTDVWIQRIAWAPDGGDIAVSYTKRDEPTLSVGLVSVGRGVLRALSHGDGPDRNRGLAFSPDGRALAYSRAQSVFVLPLDGSGERRLLGGHFQGWTPNGRGIVFTSNRSGNTDLWRVHVDKGRAIDLPALLLRDVGIWGASPGLMPNGALYYSVGRELAESQSDLYIVSTDPRTGRVLSAPAAIGQSGRPGSKPVWSRDGQFLAFRVNSFPGRAISILSLETGTERRVQIPASANAGPRFDWSPDQRFFLFGRTRIDAETGAAVAIAGLGQDTRWLPDGGSVMHPHSEPGRYGIAMSDLEADGLSVRPPKWVVDVGQSVLRCYAVSPDATAVAWVARDDGRRATLRVTDVTGGATRVLADLQSPNPIDVCTWAADGKHVVFVDTTAATTITGTDYKQSELWRVPAAGGTPEKLGLTLDHIVFPAFSPDGRFLAFGANRHGPGGLFMIENFLPARWDPLESTCRHASLSIL